MELIKINTNEPIKPVFGPMTNKAIRDGVEIIELGNTFYVSISELNQMGYKITPWCSLFGDVATVSDTKTGVVEDHLLPLHFLELSIEKESKFPKDVRTFNTYFIVNESKTRVKIGKAYDPERRLKELSTTSPESLSILLVINKDIERELHGEFATYRKNGEWFEFSKEIKDFISQHNTNSLKIVA